MIYSKFQFLEQKKEMLGRLIYKNYHRQWAEAHCPLS